MDSHIRDHFNQIARDYDRWKERAHLYYATVKRCVAEYIPQGRRVIEIGCGTGDIIADLNPSEGVGLDISEEMVAIARQKHPDLHFDVHDITRSAFYSRFDFLVSVDVLEHVPDLDAALCNIAETLTEGGLAVITTANPKWSPILHTAERLGLKMPGGDHEWRSPETVTRAGSKAGLHLSSFDRFMLVPKEVPLLAGLNNATGKRSLRQRYGLIQRFVFRNSPAV